MFERFSDSARRTVVLAQEQARQLRHDYIGTEHLLLGIVDHGESVAARALLEVHVSVRPVHHHVEAVVGKGRRRPRGHIPFTPRAKGSLERAAQQANELGSDLIGPEHVLLGILSQGDGVAVSILQRLDVDLVALRQRVIELATDDVDPGDHPLDDRAGATLLHAEAFLQPGDPPVGPTCPRCDAEPDVSLGARLVTANDAERDRDHEVVALSCRRCGAALGFLPDVPPGSET